MLGHRRSIQGGSSSCMNPSFKRAKKRPNWNVEREKDRVKRETREWKVVVGAVVGYCSRPNRRGEVKKKEQRQRTKGGKKCQKKKTGTRVSRCFIAGGFVVLTERWTGWGVGGTRLKGGTEGAEDPTGIVKVTLGYRRLIKSTDSSHVEMISVPTRERSMKRFWIGS